jgi:hypothetical protein
MYVSESWRPVPGFEETYSVSDLGRIRSEDRAAVTRSGARRRYKGQPIRPCANPKGYLFVRMNVDGVKTIRYVSVTVLTTFVGPRPDGMEACHNNGDRSDNRLVNLRWDTSSENNLDRVRHGTHNHTRKTHCPRDHPLREPNLVAKFWRKGHRVCRACYLASKRVQYARRGGRPEPDMAALADELYRHQMWTPEQ